MGQEDKERELRSKDAWTYSGSNDWLTHYTERRWTEWRSSTVTLPTRRCGSITKLQCDPVISMVSLLEKEQEGIWRERSRPPYSASLTKSGDPASGDHTEGTGSLLSILAAIVSLSNARHNIWLKGVLRVPPRGNTKDRVHLSIWLDTKYIFSYLIFPWNLWN